MKVREYLKEKGYWFKEGNRHKDFGDWMYTGLVEELDKRFIDKKRVGKLKERIRTNLKAINLKEAGLTEAQRDGILIYILTVIDDELKKKVEK